MGIRIYMDGFYSHEICTKKGDEDGGDYKQCLLFIEYAKICVNKNESVKNARTHVR